MSPPLQSLHSHRQYSTRDLPALAAFNSPRKLKKCRESSHKDRRRGGGKGEGGGRQRHRKHTHKNNTHTINYLTVSPPIVANLVPTEQRANETNRLRGACLPAKLLPSVFSPLLSCHTTAVTRTFYRRSISLSLFHARHASSLRNCTHIFGDKILGGFRVKNEFCSSKTKRGKDKRHMRKKPHGRDQAPPPETCGRWPAGASSEVSSDKIVHRLRV